VTDPYSPAPPDDGPDAARAARGRREDRSAGALVLIGGACDPLGAALGAFLDLSGARDGAPLVGFTTASADPAGSARAWARDFALAGVADVSFPLVDRRQRAQDARIADQVREARGIFLGGGDQVKLVSVLGGSAVGRAIRDAYERGAVVCGTSAGAAAITETILAYGEPDEAGTLVEMYLGPGLGLLGFHTMIDTHFAARRRLHRLFLAIARNPELMGLGIDEDTALVVRGHLGRVVGAGGVTFVDGRSVRYDNAAATRPADPAALTLSFLRVGLVGAGHELNLRERELEVVVQGGADGMDGAAPTPTVTAADAAPPERAATSADAADETDARLVT
jgi:cyanophycinase